MPTSDFPPNNPYIAGSPLKGQEMFFGRDDIFEKVRANVDEVTEQLLPAINEKYRELIIEWLTGGAIVEKVIGLFAS